MKRLIVFFGLLLGFAGSHAQCPNGDGEMNGFMNWQGYIGTNTGGSINLGNFVPGFVNNTGPVNDRHSIVWNGNSDPIVGAAIPQVAEGTYGFKLGNTLAGAQAEIMSYTFTVPANFSFSYALVLQDPGHDPSNQPFFAYWISSNSSLPFSIMPPFYITSKQFVADGNNPFFKNMSYNGSNLVYKEWQTECPDLSAYVGQTLTIYFATADCAESGHFGYAYIDGLCKPNNAVPVLTGPTETGCNSSSPLIVDGSGTTNETSYSWTIDELAPDGSDPANGPQVTSGEIFAPVSNLNVYDYWVGTNHTFISGRKYKVTLAVKSCSGTWQYTSLVITVNYPDLQATNQVICCGQGTTLSAVYKTQNGFSIPSFKWYDDAGNYLGTGSSVGSSTVDGSTQWTNTIPVMFTRSTKFKVVLEDGLCRNERWVFVTRVYPYITGNFSCENYNPCTGSGTIRFVPNSPLCDPPGTIDDFEFHNTQALNSLSYTWNTGNTGPVQSVSPGNTYTVTIHSVCGDNSASFTPRALVGAFPTIWAPVTMTASSNPLIIYDQTMAAGAPMAYNANMYRLRIYDRFGNMKYERWTTSNCPGFTNGEIRWDGRDNNGNLLNLPNTYTWELVLYNCTSNNNMTKYGTVELLQ